jgi:hypothetical protein
MPQMASTDNLKIWLARAMTSKPLVGSFLKILLILAPSVMAGAQTQPAERQSVPPHGSEKYWLEVDEFADRAVHFAYAKRFVQVHGGSVTDRQCKQYSRIATDYADQLTAVKKTGMSTQNGFWNDVREYSIGMIGPPGVPIPLHRTGKYRVTTGSEAEDRDLRRMVLLEIDEATSQLVSASNPQCPSKVLRLADLSSSSPSRLSSPSPFVVLAWVIRTCRCGGLLLMVRHFAEHAASC